MILRRNEILGRLVTKEINGSETGSGLSIGIVVAQFNREITERLLDGAIASLSSTGVSQDNITVAWVPGSFEIPGAVKLMCLSKKFDALICLGAVIKGETDHHQYISAVAADGIGKIARKNNLPIIFGILTTDNIDQALDRCGGRDSKYIATARGTEKSLDNLDGNGEVVGNVGFNAGLDAVRMINVYKLIADL